MLAESSWSDDFLELAERAVDVVVDDHGGRTRPPGSAARRARSRRSSISPSPRSPARAAAARSPRSVGASTKIVTAPGTLRFTSSAPCGLEVEERDPALGLDAVDLGAERPASAAPRNVDVLEEVPGGDLLREVLGRDEPVLAAVLLALAATRARRRGDRELEVRHLRQQRLFERAFAGTRGPGDDEDRGLAASTCGRAQ